MSSMKSNNIKPNTTISGLNEFPANIISDKKSLSYEYAYFLSRPYFHALLSDQELDSNEFAKVFMSILRIHIRKKLHSQNIGIDGILKHIQLLEDVDLEKALYTQFSDSPFDKSKLEELENRLKSNKTFSEKTCKEYLSYIDDLKNGLKEVKAYYSEKGENLHKKLIQSRLYDIYITQKECEFGFNKETIVKVSYNNNTFILEFRDMKEKAREIINWLLLAESSVDPKFITENNQQKFIIISYWHIEQMSFAVEAIYRILVYYYKSDTSNSLRDFSLTQAKKGCFIATAAYGSSLSQEVFILRRWRDRLLLKKPFGRIFVNAYYKISPPIARIIEKSKILKRLVKAILKPLILYIKSKKL